ncbi:MAG: MaoC family dehydratase [Sphingomonadales bacterium]
MDKDFLEDFEKGQTMVSPGRTITESDIHSFAALTGDWHPIHTDVTIARQGPFGEPIAHGLLILSIGSALGYRLGQYVLLPKSFIAFYGIQDLRFTAPVKVGDTIHLAVEVIDVVFKDDRRGVVVSRNEIRNQNGEPVCVFTAQFLCGRRPKQAEAGK